MASGIPYTIVRPGGLVGGGFGTSTDSRAKGREAGKEVKVIVGAEGDVDGARDILRADVARIIASVLEERELAEGKTIECVAKPATGTKEETNVSDALGNISKDN
ncbi:hypothetical protein TrRE_jg7136 [Triparma retinervis]|uniref:NAD(P)-binding domain-containing protein n=1 Tax=Triparma retinervis TaxID=2557542 RepID=A0A9W7AUE5_9STRA|nr:hypothetical protein TrRE_jg7136 [Triparma retinervis]